jgi:hypothetical protein
MITYSIKFDSTFMEIENGLIHLHYWNADTNMIDGKSFKTFSDLKQFAAQIPDVNLKYCYQSHIDILESFFAEFKHLNL